LLALRDALGVAVTSVVDVFPAPSGAPPVEYAESH